MLGDDNTYMRHLLLMLVPVEIDSQIILIRISIECGTLQKDASKVSKGDYDAFTIDTA